MTDPALPDVVPPPAPKAPNAMVAAIIRTLVPLVIGLVVKGLAFAKIDWTPNDFARGVIEYGLTIVVVGAYYYAVRILERVKSSKFGWLLGYAAAPVYPTAGAAGLVQAKVVTAIAAVRMDGKHEAKATPDEPPAGP